MITIRKLAAAAMILSLVLAACTSSDTGRYYPKQDNTVQFHENIDDLFDQYFNIRIELEPQRPLLSISRRYPQEIAPSQEDKLTPLSFEYQLWQVELAKNTLEVLEQYSDQDLTPEQRVNKAILEWSLELTVDGEEFIYHDFQVLNRVINQSDLITFMEYQHGIETLEDAENYLARLEQFPLVLGQLQANLETQQEMGLVPPASILDTASQVLMNYDRPVRANRLRQDFATKVDNLEAKDELIERCEQILREDVNPAYKELGKQIADMRPEAVQNISELPQGKEYFAWLIRSWSTTDMAPEEVHQFGLDEVARLQDEIKQTLESMGYDGNNYAETLTELDDASIIHDREQILTRYTELVAQAEELLPELFGLRHQSLVEAKAVPVDRERYEGMRYVPPPVDGSQPGIFYFNLSSGQTEMRASYFAWHEMVPGHHMQLTMEREADIPYFRDFQFLTGYVEGWATYAERLFFEFDLVDDPIGSLGAQHRHLMSAARVVVDTGLSYKGWSEEEAAQYYSDATGSNNISIPYILSRPGRSLSYHVGMISIRQSRERAEVELGDAFDIREFHDLVLQYGSMPLGVLDKLVDEYIEENKY